ncbi:AAA family ATPase [Halobacterium sp. KA-6]|uniref:AAA family ATPase n=1 Tax=Halobacterium sp. KA-6 TaxID=2896368 RepID=UPI001E44AF2B|nr:MoxR family ATPase [Halobacterium sp. KA-6]MCD2204894.1 MoxR family ATPase [Halobacterium sp. KA-6]
MDSSTARDRVGDVLEEVQAAVIADDNFLESVMTALLADGHALLEDVPGTGKTLTAQSFATALGLEFSRIQFTPDLLPADITGSNIYNEAEGTFEFQPGPVFANVVLADEINRAPPKTQAALLEAMGEGQVSVNGTTHELPSPFFVIATQNPVEQEGTFGLPEAQRDRFMVKTSMGYPGLEGELELIDRRANRFEHVPSVTPVLDGAETVADLQHVPETVDVETRLREYLVRIGRQTREDDRVDVGVSPRGIQKLFEASRARATLAGRDYVVPDDIKTTAIPALQHRLVLTAEADAKGVEREAIIEDVLDQLSVPGVTEEE